MSGTPDLPPPPNLAEMRISYTAGTLDLPDLKKDPMAQFDQGVPHIAVAHGLEPNAMTLATVGADLRPTTRTVLLKHWDPRGFVFFTNLESRKAQQIAANPNVSVLFTWLPLQRQLAIQGTAERVSHAEVLSYFIRRPYGSQLAAWVSPQSKIITTRSLLEMKWEEMKRKFREGEVPLPSFWGGFRIVPREMEFWQGRESRLHDRFLYTRGTEDTWTLERLAP